MITEAAPSGLLFPALSVRSTAEADASEINIFEPPSAMISRRQFICIHIPMYRAAVCLQAAEQKADASNEASAQKNGFIAMNRQPCIAAAAAGLFR